LQGTAFNFCYRKVSIRFQPRDSKVTQANIIIAKWAIMSGDYAEGGLQWRICLTARYFLRLNEKTMEWPFCGEKKILKTYHLLLNPFNTD
jgi:hypothetical protein